MARKLSEALLRIDSGVIDVVFVLPKGRIVVFLSGPGLTRICGILAYFNHRSGGRRLLPCDDTFRNQRKYLVYGGQYAPKYTQIACSFEKDSVC